MISICNLSKKFGENQVLSSLDVDIKQEGIVAILGPNGSGKTTLIKCILGLIIPDEGDILFDKQSILGKYDYRVNVSHLPQKAEFPDNLSVNELFHLMKPLRNGITVEDELIEAFDLNKELDKRVSHLSGGTKQKVNLVTTLMFKSDIIILDEPTSGLDPLSIINLKEILNKRVKEGSLIIITTHIMSFAENLANHIIYLLDGQVFYDGSTMELIDKSGTTNLEFAIAGILKHSKTSHIARV